MFAAACTEIVFPKPPCAPSEPIQKLLKVCILAKASILVPIWLCMQGVRVSVLTSMCNLQALDLLQYSAVFAKVRKQP